MLEAVLRTIKRFIPQRLFALAQPMYHYALAFFGALIYRFPSREITLIGVTGTKGKTTVTELLNAIFEEAGCRTALASTWRMKIGDETRRNMYKMTMPGRFFLPHFLRHAVRAGCDYAIVEMTSEGAKQFRHKFLQMDALVFTNLTPEHIDSHGSYENYVNAKLAIARALANTSKPDPLLVANAEANEVERFLSVSGLRHVTFSSETPNVTLNEASVSFSFEGESVTLPLAGKFNVVNALAAATTAREFDIAPKTIVRALNNFSGMRGRMEEINEGQPFRIIIDYAHTPESLTAVYETFPEQRKICVLGGTGGGRDRGKRKTMGTIADTYCTHVIITDEDPYDEDPAQIMADVAEGVKEHEPVLIPDRREAIRHALIQAEVGDVICITGKGTDPYIMGPRGTRTPWDDADIARKELQKQYKNP